MPKSTIQNSVRFHAFNFGTTYVMNDDPLFAILNAIDI